jgi:hypothetical protein
MSAKDYRSIDGAKLYDYSHIPEIKFTNRDGKSQKDLKTHIDEYDLNEPLYGDGQMMDNKTCKEQFMNFADGEKVILYYKTYTHELLITNFAKILFVTTYYNGNSSLSFKNIGYWIPVDHFNLMKCIISPYRNDLTNDCLTTICTIMEHLKNTLNDYFAKYIELRDLNAENAILKKIIAKHDAYKINDKYKFYKKYDDKKLYKLRSVNPADILPQ